MASPLHRDREQTKQCIYRGCSAIISHCEPSLFPICAFTLSWDFLLSAAIERDCCRSTSSAIFTSTFQSATQTTQQKLSKFAIQNIIFEKKYKKLPINQIVYWNLYAFALLLNHLGQTNSFIKIYSYICLNLYFDRFSVCVV